MHRLKLLLPVVAAIMLVGCASHAEWYNASRISAGIAPDPKETEEAVIQVYGADTWGWRGWFAIHTWIAVKRTGARQYTVYDVFGWRGNYGGDVLRIRQDIPDRHWYGEKPELLGSYRGEGVDALIDAVDVAARAYPWRTVYKAFPGPNSNTFTAWVARQVPALGLDLPFSAIGSGYVGNAN
ncbi:MAG: DUF3750 domain-containing protein [Gammaproteobacteria bacterium]|nr:DUF3750 domain-containing protein [Gammaproteobacteria bacterium]